MDQGHLWTEEGAQTDRARPRRAGQVAVKTGPARGRARGGADTLRQLPGSHNWGEHMPQVMPVSGVGGRVLRLGRCWRGGPCGHVDSATRFQIPSAPTA